MIERVLRWTALAIAVLAFVDPPVPIAGRTRPRISLVVQDGPSMALPAREGGESRRTVGARVRQTLRDRLAKDFFVEDGADATADAVVVIGDRYPDDPVGGAARVSTVTLSSALTPNVRIVDVAAPRGVPAGTAVPLSVALESNGLANTSTTVVVRTGGVEVARSEHRWTAAAEAWRAEVSAVPLGEPPFRFDVTAEPLPAERTDGDNRALVSVGLAPRLRVLAIEARPSWSAAFVRRALESDPRFEVSGLLEPSPRGTVRSGASPNLDPDRLDAFDAILVGGLDRLSPANLTTLDRFMRQRGGGVVLLPDAPVPDVIGRQLPSGTPLHETLLDRAAPLETANVPRIDASELLEAGDLPAGATVVASAAASRRPVIWTIARGHGRLLMSGAMDAWRFRADAQVGFDRFWQSVVSGLALDAAPAVRVELTPRRAAVGERVRVDARVRSLERERVGDRLSLSARAGARDPIRLWPDAAAGVFTGSFVVEARDRADVVVTASLGDGAASGSARLVVDANAREAGGPPLALLATTRGGVDVDSGNLAALERHLRATTPSAGAQAVGYPLRSAWWLVPFCAALSAEWWLRRRRGAR
jgi:hypothetical protein